MECFPNLKIRLSETFCGVINDFEKFNLSVGQIFNYDYNSDMSKQNISAPPGSN